MNAHRRNTKLSEEEAVKVKVMLHYKIPGKDIARRFGVRPAAISHINTGINWKDVIVDFDQFSAGPCIGCGRLLIDDVDELIYLVADDEYACNQTCLDAFVRHEVIGIAERG